MSRHKAGRKWETTFDGEAVTFHFHEIKPKDVHRIVNFTKGKMEAVRADETGLQAMDSRHQLARTFLPKYATVSKLHAGDGGAPVTIREIVEAAYFRPLAMAAFDALMDSTLKIINARRRLQ